MCGEKDKSIEELNLKQGAENYFKDGGLTQKEIKQIEEYLCK